MKEGDFRYLAEDEDVEDEDLDDASDWEVEDETPCGGYLLHMDDGGKEKKGGGSFDTSQDVAMAA